MINYLGTERVEEWSVVESKYVNSLKVVSKKTKKYNIGKTINCTTKKSNNIFYSLKKKKKRSIPTV